MTARTPVPPRYSAAPTGPPIGLRPARRVGQVGAVTERKYPDMWVDPEDDPRETGVIPRGEKAVVAGYLRGYRLTFEMKCEGLDAEQLARRSVPPSTMSLLGLLRHLAKVEHSWFRRHLDGQDIPRLYHSDEDRDLDFNGSRRRPGRRRRGLGVLASRGRLRRGVRRGDRRPRADRGRRRR